MNEITQWMSWMGGVDLVATTSPEMEQPNVIIHVARQVETPVGTAASGMILWMPEPENGPAIMGFISEDRAIGEYFGPNIFAGTPFEEAPVLTGQIDIAIIGGVLRSTTQVLGHIFEVELSGFGPMQIVNRAAGNPLPFNQSGSERVASSAKLRVDGVEIPIFVPEIGLTGGFGAVDARFGFYAR